MKILYLAQSSIPSRTANSMHVMKMAQAFVQAGYDFKLLARHAVLGQVINASDIKSHYGLQCEIPMHLLRPLPGLKAYGIAIQEAIYAVRSSPSVVLTRDIPTAAAVIALGVRTILELHSPDMGPLKARLFRRMVRRPQFAGLVVITHALKQELLLRHAHLKAEQILLAPDAVDLERFEGLPCPPEARSRLGLLNTFTAGYAGHLYAGRGVELIMELAGARRDVQFLIVGGNPQDVERCKKAAQSKGLDNMLFKGFVPNGELPMYLAASDLLLMPYQRTVSVSGGGNTANWMSPMKAFEYMAAARPILASDLPALAEVLDDHSAFMCGAERKDDWLRAIDVVLGEDSPFSDKAAAAAKKVQQYTWGKRVENIMAQFGAHGS